MCDEHFEEDLKNYAPHLGVTRRQFGVASVGAMALLLPGVANAQAVTESEVNVKTPDGVADCYFVHPRAAPMRA